MPRRACGPGADGGTRPDGARWVADFVYQMLARASAHDMLVRPPGRWAGDPQHAYRAVQDARKAAGLDVSDRIGLTLTVPDDHVADVRKHREFVAAETLAVSLDVVPGATLAVEVVEA